MPLTNGRPGPGFSEEITVPAENYHFFRWARPASRWEAICLHLPLALITGIPLFLASLNRLDHLPHIPCTFLQLTGYPCPFCGLTRSFQAMASGDFGFAVYNSPLGVLTYLLTVLVFLWNMTALPLGVKITPGQLLKVNSGRGWLLFGGLTALVLVNWVYRLLSGLA